MTLELKMLALSIVLGLVHIVLASHAASLQRGYVWTASSRDEAVPALTGVAGRLARALQNFGEPFPLFAAGVQIAHVAATHSWMTEMHHLWIVHFLRLGTHVAEHQRLAIEHSNCAATAPRMIRSVLTGKNRWPVIPRFVRHVRHERWARDVRRGV